MTRSVVLALVIVAAVVGLGSAPADAHPLGNFTVNRYARVEVSGPTIRIYYVLDEAEIPAFQERRAVAADEDGFLADRVSDIAAGLELEVDGRSLPLTAIDTSLDQPMGQGGLRTLRVAAIYTADLPDAPAGTERTLTFRDGNEPDRLGWREIVAVARGDGRLTDSTAPDRDISDELRSYPGDLLQAPLDLREATVGFVAGTDDVDAAPLPRNSPEPDRAGGTFAGLITRDDVDAGVLAGLLGIALLVGAGHALLPGHGKTVMAAYLVGTKGRPIDAVLLGVIVSFMHTASVLVLGLALFRLSREAAVEQYYPALTVASGIAAALLGLWLLIKRVRAYRAQRAYQAGLDHTHDHDHHHGPGHRHHHGPGGHTHELPADVPPLSRRGLILLATSGGIVPSPTAVIVIVSAFSLDRIPLGLALTLAFSVGLAVTLTAVGLALVFGRGLIEKRWPGRTIDALPAVGAAALVVLGLVLALRGATGRI